MWGDAILILQQRRRNKKTKGTCLALPFITNWRIKRQKRIDVGDLGVIWAWQNIFHAENKNQMRWGVAVIGWLNLCFFVYSVHVRIYILFCFFFFFFLFIACTSVFFFFRIVRTYVLSLLFFVYRVHINNFFLLYCKNICTLQCGHQSFFFFSIVRIYILSLFFVYTSIIFFFYKNLCTFFVSIYSLHFRIRINLLNLSLSV